MSRYRAAGATREKDDSDKAAIDAALENLKNTQ